MPVGGHITIIGKVLKDEVKITVSDTGCGIPDEIKEEIFKDGYSYWENEIDKHNKTVSNGKGLYYMKSILELFGGMVEVKSKKSRGTTFIILLPIENEIEIDKGDN